MRMAGIARAVDFRDEIKRLIERQAPQKWLSRLLSVLGLPLDELRLGTYHSTVPIIAPLFAAVTLSREELIELFGKSEQVHR